VDVKASTGGVKEDLKQSKIDEAKKKGATAVKGKGSSNQKQASDFGETDV
jgi:hypothetical protein